MGLDVDLDAEPRPLADQQARRAGTTLAEDTTVQPIAGRDDAVLLTWIGGACDDRAIVSVDADAGSYGVTIDSPSSAMSCSAVGIIRSLVLELTEPVGADAFHMP